MIPAVSKKGRSFKGAALYYLHDKGALTDERVAFTHTANLPTNDPHMAARMMAYTAMHQAEIKLAAGGAAKGRKLGLPVYAYSLAWHPTEEPTREEMIEAAQQTMKALDLEGHEVVMIAHNDEEHPHLHVLVNRVHPETGIAAKLSNDRLKLSTWAETYERDRGQIFCEQRVENNRLRQTEFRKDRQSQNHAEFHRWRREQTLQRVELREEILRELSDQHRKEQLSLFEAKEREITDKRAELKERARPFWAALYQEQRLQRQDLETQQATIRGRLRYFLKQQDRFAGSTTRLSVRGLLSRAFKAVTTSREAFADLDRQQAERKKFLSDRANAAVRAELKKINAEYVQKRAELAERQRKERVATKEAQSRQSQKDARELTSGKKREEFDRITGKKPAKAPELDRPPAPSGKTKEEIVQAEQEKKAEAQRAKLEKLEETKREITHDAKAEQQQEEEETKTKRKDTYRAFRDMADEATREQEAERKQKQKDESKTKGGKRPYRAFRDMAEGKTREQEPKRKQKDESKTKDKRPYRAFRDMAEDRDRDEGRDDDKGIEPTPKKKPPTPPKNDR